MSLEDPKSQEYHVDYQVQLDKEYELSELIKKIKEGKTRTVSFPFILTDKNVIIIGEGSHSAIITSYGLRDEDILFSGIFTFQNGYANFYPRGTIANGEGYNPVLAALQKFYDEQIASRLNEGNY